MRYEKWDLSHTYICKHRVPLLNQESIDNYYKYNIVPHIGTSYGDIEKQSWQELKLAAKLGYDLAAYKE